jgi:hypothetical protein
MYVLIDCFIILPRGAVVVVIIWFESCSWQGVLETTLYDKVCQRLMAGWWFSPGTLISSTSKTERHDITEILLKVALNTITKLP